MFREAVIVVSPPGKHDGLLVCKRLSERSSARSEVQCINEGALMNDEDKWMCLFSNEASTRHLGTRNNFER